MGYVLRIMPMEKKAMRHQRNEVCLSLPTMANYGILPLKISWLNLLLLIFIPRAEGFIHTSCRIGAEALCNNHRHFSGTSTTTSNLHYIRSLWTSLRQNVDAISATDVASLDFDGDLEMNENAEKEPWWTSYRFNDEELPAVTRPDFPILNKPLMGDIIEDAIGKPLIYLDSAATSQKPTYVTDKVTFYYHNVNSNVHRGAHTLSRESTNMYEAARDQVAKFINAYSRNEVIFTSGATEAINLVAHSWGKANLRSGDEIILTVAEHHSNIVPWQIIAQQTGAILKFVPLITSDNGDMLDWAGSFHDLLSEKTKVVSFQHASNVLGNINPVHQIVKMTRSRASPDCIIMLDACQSVPHQPVDVQALGVDFLAASGHKMCAPTGIGFLWGREHLLNKMPPFKGGGEMIHEVFLTHSTYALAPGRFEAGTPPISEAIGLGAAIEYLSNIGMNRIATYEHELGKYMYQRMKEIPGIRLLGPSDKRSSIVAFVVDGVHPSDLSTFLDMEGIAIRAGHHCCQPLHRELGISHSARASLYFYNTREEVELFIEKLEETLQFFKSADSSTNEGFF